MENRASESSPDKDLEKRFEALSRRLDEKRDDEKRNASISRPDEKSGFARALKMSSEFIAAVLVGAALGYFLDTFAGTQPWGMIVFLLLGFVAGVVNVLRSSGELADPYRSAWAGGKRNENGDAPAKMPDEEEE